jgi:hypothetical protein
MNRPTVTGIVNPAVLKYLITLEYTIIGLYSYALKRQSIGINFKYINYNYRKNGFDA